MMVKMRLIYIVCVILFSFFEKSIGHSESKITIAEEKLKKADNLLHEVLEWFSKQKHFESYNEYTVFTTAPKDLSNLPRDCTEVKKRGITKSGVYEVRPVGRTTKPVYFKVYCDMETDGGGWTVFQRRGDFGHPKDYFFRNWHNYTVGFGNVDEDFWLGNDKIHSLTSQGKYTLRIDMKDKEGNQRYAQYQGFSIGGEKDQYQLHISTYTGDAGDSMTNHHNNRKFSTFDRDNDDASAFDCSNHYKGAWWYDSCYDSSLNGLYLNGPHKSYADGVEWFHWKGLYYSIPDVEMKMRRN